MPMIKCPYCKKLNTKLLDGVRHYKRGYIRIRVCNDCGKRFTTVEEVKYKNYERRET